MIRDQPTPDFFEGLLLGNGDIGVCVTVRPDAIGLHIGKNDSWDIRVSEEHVEKMLPFREVLQLWQKAGDEAKRQGKPEMTYLEQNIDFFRKYTEEMASSYRKPWPRPWPCGIIWLHWDSRTVRVVRQRLDIATGSLTVELEWDDLRGKVRPVILTCIVCREEGHVVLTSDAPSPVTSAAYYPHWDKQALLPEPVLSSESPGFACYQKFPATAPKEGQTTPASDKDRSFALHGVLAGSWVQDKTGEDLRGVLLRSTATQPLRLDVALFTTADHRDNVAHAKTELQRFAKTPVARLAAEFGGSLGEILVAVSGGVRRQGNGSALVSQPVLPLVLPQARQGGAGIVR